MFFLLFALFFVCLCFVFIGWVVVGEATSVSFQYLGGFACKIMEFAGHHYDDNGFVVLGNGATRYGKCWAVWRYRGLVLYIRFLVKPTLYEEKNDPDGLGAGYAVFLNDQPGELLLIKAETSEKNEDGEDAGSIALDVAVEFIQKITNPYLYQFVAPKDAKKRILKRLEAALRAFIKSGDEPHAQNAKGNGEALWAELMNPNGLCCQPLFEQIQGWGYEIIPKSIVIADINYNLNYQDALEAEKRERLNAKGTQARIFDPIMAVLPDGAKLSSDQAVMLRALDLSPGYSAQNNQSTQKLEVDVHSAGQPVNPQFGGVVAAAEVVGDAIARAMGKRGPVRPQSEGGSKADSKKDKSGGKPGGGQSDREVAAETYRTTGQWPDWWDPMKQQRK